MRKGRCVECALLRDVNEAGVCDGCVRAAARAAAAAHDATVARINAWKDARELEWEASR